MEKLLKKYGRLIVSTGVHLKKDQLLVINAPIACADFARIIAREAYKVGARDVVIQWNDELFSKLRFEMAEDVVFQDVPNWRKSFYIDYAREDAAFVSILSSDPEIFKTIDPSRLSMAQQANAKALKEYRERLMSNKNAWCVVSIPTNAWAAKVFPEVSEEEAMELLWKAIFSAVRIDADSDPVENWEQHLLYLERARVFMNTHRFTKLHYKNSLGTDLWIELPEDHIWASGAEEVNGSWRFVANMPTEEVYTLPKAHGVNGTVYSTKPLNYNGVLIEDMVLTFKDGEVVSFEAKKGKEMLRQLLSTDAGSCRLGEVALVPKDSPISKSGILFYNTLFDENASCHLAFGKAYPTCLTNGADMSEEELEAADVNESLIHEDFMIGSDDLSIYGIDREGKETEIFSQGNFVIFS